MKFEDSAAIAGLFYRITLLTKNWWWKAFRQTLLVICLFSTIARHSSSFITSWQRAASTWQHISISWDLALDDNRSGLAKTIFLRCWTSSLKKCWPQWHLSSQIEALGGGTIPHSAWFQHSSSTAQVWETNLISLTDFPVFDSNNHAFQSAGEMLTESEELIVALVWKIIAWELATKILANYKQISRFMWFERLLFDLISVAQPGPSGPLRVGW
jgi:hypothetical protein